MSKTETKKREISVIERRLKSGDVWAVGSGAIPLKDPRRWELRIANSDIRNGRVREMQHEKGWDFADEADLACTPYEIGFTLLDGRLVRGMHSQEVLMKMERTDYRAVQLAKDAEVRKNTFGKKAVKRAILQAAAQEPGGDQGAEFLNRAIQSVKTVDSREAVSLED